MPHHKLHPVHSQVQRVDGSVQVQVREALDVLLVPAERRHLRGGVQTWNWCLRILAFVVLKSRTALGCNSKTP